MKRLSDELRNAFKSGITSFMVIWPSPLKVYDASEKQGDAYNLQNDWENVGQYLKGAMYAGEKTADSCKRG